MRRIDFNLLPRSSRERFIHALASDSPTASPICRRLATSKSRTVWSILVVLGLVALVGLALPRFGALGAQVQDRRWLAGYAVATGILGLGLAGLGRRRALAGNLPYPPGVYVLPLDVVDARTRELELFSMFDLQSVEAVDHHERGTYDHSTIWLVFPTQSFTFEVRGRAYAEECVGRIANGKQMVMNAVQRGGLQQLGGLDPFVDARARNFEPAHDHGLLARDPPIWTRFLWAIALVSALLPGVGAWRLRNWGSDERAYGVLKARPSEVAAALYLHGGGLRRAEVESTLLPRIALDRALAETGAKRAEALERFLKEHPRSGVDAAARAAFAEVLHAEFLERKTVPLLRAFVERWPAAPDAPAARTRIQQIQESARKDFREHANTADRSVVPLVEAVFAAAFDQQAPLVVRFRKRTAATLVATDALLQKHLLDDDGQAASGEALTGPILGPSAIAAREALLVEGLGALFRAIFPGDVVPLSLGAPLEEPEHPVELTPSTPGKKARGAADDAKRLPAPWTPKPLDAVETPSLVVDYELGWSGTTYLTKARRRYLGLFVRIEAVLQVPKDNRFVGFSFRSESPDGIRLDGAAADDSRVYGQLVLRAFEDAAPRVLPVFFEPKTAAARMPFEF